MDQKLFDKRVQELTAVISTLPADKREALLQMVEETRQRQQDTTANLERARDALDDWRVIQKYRIFDAEASFREQAARRDEE